MNSFSQMFPDTCSACGLEHEVEVWFVVDEDERPDLVRDIIEGGTVRAIPCPRCGQVLTPYDPLIIYRPRRGGAKAMLLTFCERSNLEELRIATSFYFDWLEKEAGIRREEAVLLQVPWSLVPAILLRDFESDLRTPDALLDLPAAIADTYISMLHSIRHDRGLASEGGRILEL